MSQSGSKASLSLSVQSAVEDLKRLLLQNCYPQSIITFNNINDVLKKIKNKPNEPTALVLQKDVLISLSYIGVHSNHIALCLKSCVNSSCFFVNVFFNVLPKFVRVELPNVSQNDIISIRKFLLKSAVTKRAKESRKLRQTKDVLSNKIKEVLTGLDFYVLRRVLSKNVDKAANKVIMTHQKKLEKLTRNTFLPFTSDETVTNISSTRLTQEPLGILKRRLNQSICPPKISKSDVFN